MIFNSPSYPEVAQFVPWGTGYGEFFYGKVVDMFYFPLIEWDMPNVSWLPYSGEHCVFFSPIFNFADASISCGIISLILFYNKIISKIGFFKDAAEEDSVQEDSNKNN
jgi:signal peptidase II